MEKQRAEEARDILNKIMIVEDKTKNLNKMRGWNLQLCTVNDRNGLTIPDELQETIYILVNTAFENELNELRKKLESL